MTGRAAMQSLSKFLALEGNIRVLALQTFLSQLGFGMVLVVWQPYILSTGLSVVDLGTIQSVINLSAMAGFFAWGFLSDRYGRKPVVLLSMASRAASVLALIASGNVLFMYVFAFFVGFSALFYQANPARSALITESVPVEKRATAWSTLTAIGQITNMVMSSVGGYLAIVLGYWPIFVASFVFEAAGTTLIAVFARETHKPDEDPKPEREEKLRSIFVPEKGLLTFYVLMTVMGLGYAVGYSLLYGALVVSYGFTTIELGLLSTVSSLTWGLTAIPGGKLSERLGRRTMLMASWVAAMTTVIGLILFRSFPTILALQVSNGLDPCFWMPNWMSLLADRVPPAMRSRVYGKLDAYSMLASIPAPWIGGLLYSGYGFTAPLLVHLVCTLIWGYLLFRVTAGPKPAT